MSSKTKKMSSKNRLTSHLRDYVALLAQLFARFSEDEVNISSPSPVLKPPSPSPNDDFVGIVNRLVDKDRHIQDVVDTLIAQLAFEAKLRAVQSEINTLDTTIVRFAHALAAHEQRLHEGVNDAQTRRNIDGVGSFRVEDVCKFAEQLACSSFSPADYQSQQGMNPNRYRRPHPDETAIATSSLTFNVDKLLEFARQNQAESGVGGGAEGDMGTDTTALTAFSVQETSFAADGAVGAIAPPKDWKPTKLQATVTKRETSNESIGLELDLNPDLSSDDDDDFDDEDFDSD